jgi:hypothetical protein
MGSEAKVVAITYENYVADTARSAKEKTFGPRSWKRADGERSSKKCEHSVLGFVAAGVHRGDAFSVCIAKEKCKTHWAAAMREKKQRADEREKTSSKPTTAAAAKAPPKVDLKLQSAIQKAADAARDEATEACLVAAAKLTPEAFIRMAAAAQNVDLESALRDAGEKVRGEKAIIDWCHKAPLAQVQRMFVSAMIQVLELEVYTEPLGVDATAIEKRLVAEARAKHAAAQTSAPAKGKPAKAAKPSKSKPAPADDDMGDEE